MHQIHNHLICKLDFWFTFPLPSPILIFWQSLSLGKSQSFFLFFVFLCFFLPSQSICPLLFPFPSTYFLSFSISTPTLTLSHYLTLLICHFFLALFALMAMWTLYTVLVCLIKVKKKIILLIWLYLLHSNITLISAYSQLLYISTGHSLECHLKCIEAI